MNSAEAKIPNVEGDWQSIDIFLFSNGQQYSPPRKYHLRAEELNWWESALKHLAQSHYGIQHPLIYLYTTDGHLVEGPLELKDGQAYVAVEPQDAFIDAGYQKYLIRAIRSWEKRQARKFPASEPEQPGCLCPEKEVCKHHHPCCLCPEKEEAASPEPLMAATGHPELKPPGGHFMSAVYTKPVGADILDDYGPRSGTIGATVGEPESTRDEHEDRSGEQRARPYEYSSSSVKGGYESGSSDNGPWSSEIRPKIKGQGIRLRERKTNLVESADRSVEDSDRSVEHGSRPRKHGARPTKDDAGTNESYADAFGPRLDGHKAIPGEHKARPGENGAGSSKHGVRSSEHGARSGERGDRPEEHRAGSDEHGARPVEHEARSDEHTVRSANRGAILSENGTKIGEDAARSVEQRARPYEYGPSPVKGGAWSDESRAKPTGYESGASNSGPWFSGIGPSTGEHDFRVHERETSLEGSANRPIEDTDRSAEHGSKSRKQGTRPAKDEAGTDERTTDDFGPRFEEYKAQGARSSEQGARTGENGARSSEQGARTGENGARSGEHKARSGEPGAKSNEHGARPVEREARSDKQTVRSAERGTRLSENGTKIGEDAARSEYGPSPVKGEAHSDKHRAKPTGYESGLGDSGPWSSEIEPRKGRQDIRLRERKTNSDESSDKPVENTDRPDKYENVQGAHEGRSKELNNKLGEHRRKSGEHYVITDDQGSIVNKQESRMNESKGRSNRQERSPVVNHNRSGDNDDLDEESDYTIRLCKQSSRSSYLGGRGLETLVRGSKQKEKANKFGDRTDDLEERRAKYGVREGEQRNKEMEPGGKAGGISGKGGERRVNDDEQTKREIEHGSRASEQTGRDIEQTRRSNKQGVAEIEPKGRVGEPRGKEIEHTRRTSEQRPAEIEHWGRMEDQKGKKIEHKLKLSEKRGIEIKHGGKDIEYPRKPSTQKAGEIELVDRRDEPRARELELSGKGGEQRGREIEQTRAQLNEHRAEEILHRGRAEEPKHREIEYPGKASEPRPREFENRDIIGEQRGRKINHVGRASEQRAGETDHGPRLSEQRSQPSDHIARLKDHETRVGDYEARGGDLGIRVGVHEAEVGSPGTRVAKPDTRAAAPGTIVSPKDRISPRAKMAQPRLGIPGTRVDETAVRLGESEIKDKVGESTTRAGDIGASVVKPEVRSGYGGTGAAGVSHISEAQQHVRRSSISAEKPSSEKKKRWSVGQNTTLLRKSIPLPISSVPPKKSNDTKPIRTNREILPKKLAGKVPVPASNEVRKPKIVPKYPYKRIASPAIPLSTADVDHIDLKKKSTSLTKIISSHEALATDSAPIGNVIVDEELNIVSTHLFRNSESDIRSIRMNSVKQVVDAIEDSSEKVQTEIMCLQQSIMSNEGVQTHTELLTEAVEQHGQGVCTSNKATVKCTLSNLRDNNMVATDDPDENFISILNKGDVVNLKLNIEFRNGGRSVNNCCQNCRRSRSLTNVTRSEKGSQISFDDDILYVQSNSLQSILNNEYFRGSGFEGRPKVVVVQCACCGRQNNLPPYGPPPCCDSKKYFVLLPNSLQEDIMDDRCNCDPSCQPYSLRPDLHSISGIPIKKTNSNMTMETLSMPLQRLETGRSVTTTDSACQTEDPKNECLVTKNNEKESSSRMSQNTQDYHLVTKCSYPKKCSQVDSQVCSQFCSQPRPQEESREYPQLCPQTCQKVPSQGCSQLCPQTCQKVPSQGCQQTGQQVHSQVCLQTCSQGCPQTCPQGCPQTCPQIQCHGYPQVQSQASQTWPQVKSHECPQEYLPTCTQVQSQGSPKECQEILQVQSQVCPPKSLPAQSQTCSQVQGYPKIIQDVSDSHTQTQWCSVVLEARLNRDGQYSLHLPPLHVLKSYPF